MPTETQYNVLHNAFAIKEHIVRAIKHDICNCFQLSSAYGAKKDKLSSTLPYNLNIIEELHINENAHSRILAKLFEFKADEGYTILQSFLDLKDAVRSIKVNSPIITHNKSYIDIWIRDRDYAIIIENKACDAIDQANQIGRYIETTKDDGYRDEQIYVIYMPDSNVDPADYSWQTDKMDYKEHFKSRYCTISYQFDVLPWLKKLQGIPDFINEPMISSGLTQYIDFLEGKYGEREKLKQYYMDLKQTIKEQLRLDSLDRKSQYDRLTKECGTFLEIVNQMESMKRDIRIEYWEEQLPKKYKWRKTEQRDKEFLIGSDVKYKDEDYLLFIGEEGRQLYCQLNSPNGRQRQFDDLLKNKQLCSLLTKGNPEHPYIWEYFDDNDIKGVLQCAINVINKIEEVTL